MGSWWRRPRWLQRGGGGRRVGATVGEGVVYWDGVWVWSIAPPVLSGCPAQSLMPPVSLLQRQRSPRQGVEEEEVEVEEEGVGCAAEHFGSHRQMSCQGERSWRALGGGPGGDGLWRKRRRRKKKSRVARGCWRSDGALRRSCSGGPNLWCSRGHRAPALAPTPCLGLGCPSSFRFHDGYESGGGCGGADGHYAPQSESQHCLAGSFRARGPRCCAARCGVHGACGGSGRRT